MDDYWTEHAEIALNEAGLSATADQIEIIAGVIESAHEFYGQSMGHDVASVNYRAESARKIEALERAIIAEREKVPCRTCGGSGSVTSSYGTRFSSSRCWKCNGDGRHPQ